MNILVVEDNLNLANSIKDLLIENKYTVDVIFNGEEGLYYGKQDIYDLIIMDVMLPVYDGYTIVKQLRTFGIATPILMLTAKSELDDKVIGLDSGADDYMTKPFSTKELLARIRALSRRKSDIVTENLSIGDIMLDLSTSELSCHEKTTKLSHTEYQLLEFLINNKTTTLSKEQLIIKVWGYDSNAVENNVEVYVSFLRKKLKFLKSNVVIRNIRKLGYRIEANDDQKT
jgi:DNA-binding response OmpR family regulator